MLGIILKSSAITPRCPARSASRGALLVSLGLLLGCGAFAPLHAQTKLWDGGGNNNRWGTSNNWDANGVPTSSNDVIFNNTHVGTLPSTIELRGSQYAQTLTFSTGNTVAIVNGTGTRTLFLANGSVTSSGSGTFSLEMSTLMLQANGTFNIGNTGGFTVASTIAESDGSRTVTKSGTGVLTFTNSNTYTGATTVSAGTLNVRNSGSLGSGSGTTTVSADATLQLQDGITISNKALSLGGTLQSVSGANHWNNDINITGGSASIVSSTASNLLTLGKSDYTSTIAVGSNTITMGGAGDILINAFVGSSGDTGGFIKTGSGTVTFYGDRNFYTGTTTVNDGTLVLDTLNDIYNPDQTILGDLVIGDGIGAAESAIVRFGSGIADDKIANTSNITINSDGLLDLNLRDDTVNAITITGGRITTGTGILTILGNLTTNASSQSAQIDGYLDLDGATRTFTIADGAAASDLTINAGINFGSIVKDGTGTMTITSNNTIGYGGTTTVNAGVLNIRHGNALGQAGSNDPAKGTIVASGAALQVQNNITVGTERLTLSGTGVSNTGALRNISGNNTWNGAIVLDANSRINSDADLLTINGTITGNLATSRNLTVGGSGNTSIYGAIGTNAGTVTKDGTGTLVLAGDSTYQGVTSVTAGVVNVRHNNALGSTLGGTTVSSGAALQLQDSITVGAEALSLSGTGVANDGALRNVGGNNVFGGAVTVASANSRINSDTGNLSLTGAVAIGGNTLAVGGASNTTMSGQLSGAGVLNKDGAGTLTLSGTANTFSGAVNVTSGALTMGAHNQLNSSALNLSVTSGATVNLVSYAQSIGTLAGAGLIDFGTSGQLTLASSSTFSGAFTGTGELIVGPGATLTLGANFTANNLIITLAGGTLNLNGNNHSFGGLNVTGDSILDFAASADSTLNIGSLTFGSLSYTLAVNGWTYSQDFFTTPTSPGTRYNPPLNQVVFAGWTGDNTIWQSWDNQILPVPEPSTYGAIFFGLLLGWFGIRRWRQARVTVSQ